MKNRTIYIVCIMLSCILSNVMCAFVAYKWAVHSYNVSNSAPAYLTLINAVPFIIIISLLLIIGFKFKNK